MRVLTTKILQENNRQRIINHNFSLIESNFISLEYVDFTLNEDEKVDYYLFTSQNAVKSVLQKIPTFKNKNNTAFCVGQKTKAALEELNIKVVAVFSSAKELGLCIAKKYSTKKFLFFSGVCRRKEIETICKKNNMYLHVIEVYKTKMTPKKIESPLDAILFLSPSAVESFRRKNRLGQAHCFCIGSTTAKSLVGYTQNITISKKATEENLVYQLINTLKK